MHVVTVDVLEGTTLHDGEVAYDGVRVRVPAALAGRVVTFDESASTSEADSVSPEFTELYESQFVVLADGTGHPVWGRRDVELQADADRRYTVSVLRVPTGWVPHRLLLQPSGGWTPTPRLLADVLRTAFPTAAPDDFRGVTTTRRPTARPETALFALRAARVFSKPEEGKAA